MAIVISELKDFLRKHEREIRKKDLNRVYYDFAYNNNYHSLNSEEVPELTLFFIDHNIDPLKYFKDEIPEGYASTLNVYSSLKIPDGIKYIKDSAFDASDITSLHVPNSVEEIDFRTFADCLYLKSVYIDGCPILLGNTFKGCSNLEEVVFNCSEDKFEFENLDPASYFFEGCPKVNIIFKQ